MARFLTVALAVVLMAAGDAAAEDMRTAITLPADMRGDFLEHMRDHMDSLDDVMVELAAADFKAAATVARERLVPGTGAGFGRFLPIEFREMGLAMHRAAAEFAQVVARVPPEPTAADWQQAMTALEDITAQCRGCHSAFRIE
jgi:cytochrome c556